MFKGVAPTGHEMAHNEEKRRTRPRAGAPLVRRVHAGKRELLVSAAARCRNSRSRKPGCHARCSGSVLLTRSRPGASRARGGRRSNAAAENEQTREAFAAEAAAIAARHRRIVWRAPSRDEDTAQPVVREEAPTILTTDGDGAPTDGAAAAAIQGGRERGTILHKLIEEVLTGETAETPPALAARAETLIRALGLPVMHNPAQGLAPAELAGCVVRTLSLPEVAALRPRLVPELPVYGSIATDTYEEATAGIVDAIAFGPDGTPDVVIDWKSDVDPCARDPRALPRPGPRLPRHDWRGTRTYRRRDDGSRPFGFEKGCCSAPGAWGDRLCTY